MPIRFAAVLLFLLGSFAVAQEVSYKEAETTIRTAYAKLSYADEVHIILDTLQKTGRENLWKTKASLADGGLDSRLTFELSEFRFGKLKEIGGRKISEFDGIQTQVGGEVLDVTPSVFNYTLSGSPSRYVAYVKFSWKTSSYQYVPPSENSILSNALKDPSFDGKSYTDYATYTVSLTFQDKARTYKTLVLFGRDETKKLQIHFMDRIVDPTAVTFALEHSLYPAAFVETDLRTVPFVDKWLYDNAKSCQAKSEVDHDRQDVCCDQESGSCGVTKSSLLPRSGLDKSMHRKAVLLPASFSTSVLPIRAIPLPPPQATPTPTGCAKFNVNTVFNHGLSDVAEHTLGGLHSFTGSVQASCTYTDDPASTTGACNVQCNANSSSVMDERGGLTGLVFVHATAKADSTGSDFSNGGGTLPIACQGVSAGTVKSCTFPCSTTVSISAGGKGNLGATISFPASQIWSDQNQGQVSCQPRIATPTNTGCDTSDQSFTSNGRVVCEPLIVDLTGDGFHLTDSDHGVVFDILANNTPFKIPWTADSRNGFLVLDRNGNGLIDNGWELFGNLTPQNPSDSPNGFLSLAMYDTKAYGGNEDGVIDQRDRIFSELRVWVDANHDGVSQPGELHTLAEVGIFSISLDYKTSGKKDEFGNVFRFKSKINHGQDNDSDVGKKIYDVFFVSK